MRRSEMQMRIQAALVLCLTVTAARGVGAQGAHAPAAGPMTRADPAPLAATVLGEEVRTSDAREMQETILTQLLDHFAEKQGIEVSDADIDAYVESVKRGMRARGLTAEEALSPEEAAQVEQMRRDMGRAMIRQWKLNRALYGQYGGRIIFQQLGPEPLDAYRRYLEERQAAGDFAIHDRSLEGAFWRYFTDDSMHDFYERGNDAESKAFATPPWEPAAEAR
jgi:hypothetical protein